MENIPVPVLESAYTYTEYRHLIDRLLAEGKTTGSNHSDAMLQYTRMGVVRMNRLDRTVRLLPGLSAPLRDLKHPLTWLVLTEAWCGDAGQSLPVMAAMASRSPNIELRLILRDEHPLLMDAFLTDGGRSIPKLLMLDRAERKVLTTWGPRPRELQRYVVDGRRRLASLPEGPERKEKLRTLVTESQKWYARDKTVSIQMELQHALERARLELSRGSRLNPASNNQ